MVKKKSKPWLGECLIMVDTETVGLDPNVHSMLSIAACVVEDPRKQIYLELKPVNRTVDQKAMDLNKLDLAHLRKNGQTVVCAMRRIKRWVKQVSGSRRPIFTGRNASFDWAFVTRYFALARLKNPFHYVPLDLISYYMGMMACSFEKAQTRNVDQRFIVGDTAHHALKDVLRQTTEWQRYQQYQGERLILPNLALLKGTLKDTGTKSPF